MAENIIAAVTDSVQLQKNNELMNYIKYSDFFAQRPGHNRPEPTSRVLSTAPPSATPAIVARTLSFGEASGSGREPPRSNTYVIALFEK